MTWRTGCRSGQSGMSPEQIADRLRAFGFADAERTKAAVDELAQGLTRSSRLMGQMFPLLLDWLSVTPDPDLGLLGLRNLALHPITDRCWSRHSASHPKQLDGYVCSSDRAGPSVKPSPTTPSSWRASETTTRSL